MVIFIPRASGETVFSAGFPTDGIWGEKSITNLNIQIIVAAIDQGSETTWHGESVHFGIR